MQAYNPFEKIRMPGKRGCFPVAKWQDILWILNYGESRLYLEIEKFLDQEPKKSISEDMAQALLDRGIKISDEYVV